MNVRNAVVFALCALAVCVLPNAANAEYTQQEREYDAIFARARQRERKCTAIIAEAQRQIMETMKSDASFFAGTQAEIAKAKERDVTVIGEMLLGLGEVYGWSSDQERARKCARMILDGSPEWLAAADAARNHKFHHTLLVLGYPLMWEREHEKLLSRKADEAETIGKNAQDDFATGAFDGFPALKENFVREERI